MNLNHLLGCVRELCRYGLTFLWAIFCPKAVLAAKLLAVESQLVACKQQVDLKEHPRPRFTASLEHARTASAEAMSTDFVTHLLRTLSGVQKPTESPSVNALQKMS